MTLTDTPAGFFRCRCHKMHANHGFDSRSRCDCGRRLQREFSGLRDVTYADPGEAIIAILRDGYVVRLSNEHATLVDSGYVAREPGTGIEFVLRRVHVRYEWEHLS